MTRELVLLHELAAAHGVITSYRDMAGKRRRSETETLLGVLKALGAPVERIADARAGLRARAAGRWSRLAEPVHLAWDGRPRPLALRIHTRSAGGRVRCVLRLEGGEERRWSAAVEPARSTGRIDGAERALAPLPIPGPLPHGYHTLHLEHRGRRAEVLILAAPPAAHASEGRGWGAFIPLHALNSRASWGAGDFGDLSRLLDWVGARGGSFAGILPILAAFIDGIFEPGPYAPASRLFWNDFYIDMARVPELGPAAGGALASASFRRQVGSLRAEPLVDYRRQMALKRRALEAAARRLFRGSSARRAAFDAFRAANPRLDDYARFRAAGEAAAKPWPEWPARLRQGDVRDGDFAEAARLYHLYAQWIASEQLAALARKDACLYLDFPLGVHPASYDTWRERGSFALEAAGGCPPDPSFTRGQDWGFPPLHPERIRENGHRYFIAALRHHLQHAGALRLDHVMMLERLYWIPRGLDAAHGAYVRYPAEELAAILTLESARRRAIIVGEDLGTVSPRLRRLMDRRRFHRIYVAQLEAREPPAPPLPPPAAGAVACLNTHDMPPFAGFWSGLDIDDRLDLGLIDRARARDEFRTRELVKENIGRLGPGRRRRPTARAALAACLEALSASPAWLVLVNIEDLWLERMPQNVPGTTSERPNWRRRAKRSLEELARLPAALALLRRVEKRSRPAAEAAHGAC